MPDKSFKETIKVNKSLQQQFMENTIMKKLDTYLVQNDFDAREYFSYLTCAIYLVYKKLYPNLAIYIPFRIKSDNSAMKNIYKEVLKTLYSIDFENLTEEEELDVLKKYFTLDDLSKDFMASTVVLDHIKDYRKNDVEYMSPEIKILQNQEKKYKKVIEDTEEKLEYFLDEEEFFNLKIQLLENLVEATYPEFTNEREISFKTELEISKKIQSEKKETGNFSTSISTEQLNSLNNLLAELRSRKSDKLEMEILKETFPNVLEDPLLKKALHVSYKYEKSPLKPNGFYAIYFNINTPFGNIEFQLQSNKRYYEAKKGSAFHSGLKGKNVNIHSFFELVDPNDEHNLDFYLKAIDSFPADKIMSKYELPIFETEREKILFLRTDAGKQYLNSEKIKEYMKHIKIKDTMSYEPDITIKQKNNSNKTISITPKNAISGQFANNESETQVQSTIKNINTDEYLLSLALSLSPYMNVCHSAHTLFSSANTQAKNVEDEFSEILRKKDSLSALGNMLVERLKNILKSTDNPVYKKVIETTNKLPSDVSRADIIDYSKKLEEKLKDKDDDRIA